MEANPLLITSLFNADYKKKKKLYPLPERKGGAGSSALTWQVILSPVLSWKASVFISVHPETNPTLIEPYHCGKSMLP